MGFGSELRSKDDRDTGKLFQQVQPHDLLKFGIIPELVGRLPVITSLNSLTEDDLVRILTEPKNALCRQFKKLFSFDGVELEFTKDALRAIAQQAIERKIGARGLRAVMERILTGIMYEIPSDRDICSVRVTEDCVRKHTAPELGRKADQEQLPAANQ